MEPSPRGFALLVAVILTSVTLAIGLALLDVAYKQVLLSTNAKQSSAAFYNADATMECALYNDQQLNAFDYSAPKPSANVQCGAVAISGYSTSVSGGIRTTKFDRPCTTGGVSGTVTVLKNSTLNTTKIYASGYNTCNAADAARIERGEKITY